MKLAYWMYCGPAHIGTLRVTSSFKNVHAIMHAPLGDDYFNVMRSMLDRQRDFTPVTASIVDRHVLARGSQEKVVENIKRKDNEESPDLIVLTPTCTSSLLVEDLNNFVNRASMSQSSGPGGGDVILADVNHYRINELQAADRTLEQIVRFYLEKEKTISNNTLGIKTKKPSVNIIGIFTLGFHNTHDCRELKRLLNNLGIDVNLIIPEGDSVKNLKKLPNAWFNLIPYREVGLMTAIYLEKEFQMPFVSVTPMGIVDTALCIREIEKILNNLSFNEDLSLCSPLALQGEQNENNFTPLSPGVEERATLKDGSRSFPLEKKSESKKEDSVLIVAEQGEQKREKKLKYNFENYIENQTRYISQAAWFSRSIDCQNLTGKKAFVFGDATHAAGITKILTREMGIKVVCSGTYCKHDSDWFRDQVFGFCDQILITDDHTQVGDMIAKLEPSAIFGTQMERHIGKRLDIPCGVISTPVHIQNFPLSYRPFLGYEGTNQIADLVYNSFSLGMEDHLLEIFSGHDTKEPITNTLSTENEFDWNSEALKELSNIPGFVRGKVKRNTEKYARQNKISIITLDVLFSAKEALSA
jgi:nitrogenase molybdenum-iron protein alpha/beta subunit